MRYFLTGAGEWTDQPEWPGGPESARTEPVPLLEGTMPNPPIEGTIDMGGGIPIIVDKEVIGAIAVSGAPGWDMDEACAKAGLAKVADKLK